MKRYAVISTCLAIGAIDFEVAPSLDFFHIYSKMLYSKTGGQMLELCSDNGTNVVGAEPSGSGASLALNDHNDTYSERNHVNF